MTKTEDAVQNALQSHLICACCKIRRETTKDRDPGHGSALRHLCDDCWNSPTMAYADCLHGFPQ